MRVLWFSTNAANYESVISPKGGYNGGGWTGALQEVLILNSRIKLGVCFVAEGEPPKVEQRGVIYYPIPAHRKSIKDKIVDILRIHDVTRDEVLWPYYIEKFKKVIDDFKPDVIEVFGSELYIGLATIVAKEKNVPCALHIQGILSLYIYIYFPVGVSKWKYYLSNGIKCIYANWQYLAYWHRSVHREKVILKSAQHVIGRTDWDKHAMEILNPKTIYHYGGEILRPSFYSDSKRNIPRKPVIVTTSSNATYKGFDLVLKIANILKNEIRLDFNWKVFGNVEPRFIEKLLEIKHEEVNVQLCGVESAEHLRDSMLNATVYLQPSYVENSPNSVAEAQILGLPVVATNVGGTGSIINDGVDGFLFPCTDPYMGAWALARLIDDKNLNVEMGNAGKISAKERHDPESIVKELIKLYKEIQK